MVDNRYVIGVCCKPTNMIIIFSPNFSLQLILITKPTWVQINYLTFWVQDDHDDDDEDEGDEG